jgi:hypothetical protein
MTTRGRVGNIFSQNLKRLLHKGSKWLAHDLRSLWRTFRAIEAAAWTYLLLSVHTIGHRGSAMR